MNICVSSGAGNLTLMTSREIVDAYYSALAAMDVQAFEALHLPDVVYNVSGQTIISGRYESFAALKTILPAIFDALDFEDFHFAVKWKIMNENVDGATAIMEARGKAKNGQRYDQRYAHILFPIQRCRPRVEVDNLELH